MEALQRSEDQRMKEIQGIFDYMMPCASVLETNFRVRMDDGSSEVIFILNALFLRRPGYFRLPSSAFAPSSSDKGWHAIRPRCRHGRSKSPRCSDDLEVFRRRCSFRWRQGWNHHRFEKVLHSGVGARHSRLHSAAHQGGTFFFPKASFTKTYSTASSGLPSMFPRQTCTQASAKWPGWRTSTPDSTQLI